MDMRIDIPEEIQRFQKTLQHARSKVDYVVRELILTKILLKTL